MYYKTNDTMRIENQKMKTFLSQNGIKAVPKYQFTGSLRGRWRLYQTGIKWWDNVELQNKLNELGFTDFDGKPLNKFSGNGGMFSIFAKFNRTNEFLNQ